jgi:hypothetical protein
MSSRKAIWGPFTASREMPASMRDSNGAAASITKSSFAMSALKQLERNLLYGLCKASGLLFETITVVVLCLLCLPKEEHVELCCRIESAIVAEAPPGSNNVSFVVLNWE